MKKIISVVLLCALLVSLVGCSEETVVYLDEDGNEIKREEELKVAYDNFHVIKSELSYDILKDIETGCEYIYINNSHAGGLSPLYETSTKVKGCKE